MFDPQTFTEKTRLALSEASEQAHKFHNLQVAPLHVAAALFADADGLAPRIAEKAGAQTEQVVNALRRGINLFL